MKCEDIVRQLMAYLPKNTNLFTDQLSVAGITSASTTATANVVAHGLSVGDTFTIIDSTVDAAISSLTRVGTIASAVTTVGNDLTFDAVQIADSGPIMVTISGATEAEFNGTFELLSRTDKNNFTFAVPDSGATTATGSPVLVDGVPYGYNGTYSVATVPDVDNITYTIAQSGLPAASGTILLRKGYRISRTVNFEKALDGYTAHDSNDLWAFVEIGDVSASKDRKTQSDAIAVLGRTNSPRQQLIFPFTIYVFATVTDELTGGAIKDEMLDIQSFIFKSILGKVFDTTLACGNKNQAVFVQHGTAAYDGAVYAHAFQFETVSDTSFEDTVGDDFSVPLWDFDIIVTPAFDVSA